MAFNPFHSFRRHQKVIFAGLTIVCMGIFVLSSGMGGGDFFTQLTQWSFRRSNQDAVAKLFGKDVDGPTVREIQRRREWANRYITMLTAMARNQIVTNVVTQRERVDPPLRRIIDSFQQLLSRQNQPAQFEAGLARLQGEIGMALPALEQTTAANKKDQLKLANDLGFLFGHFRNMIGRGNDSYFGGNPRSTDDTLDFMIWQKQADKLAIKIDEPDFDEHLRRELMGQTFGKEDWDMVNRQFSARGEGVDADVLREALIEEFRVRTAKVTLAGIAPVFLTHTAPPVLTPPAEKFDWYKDATTKVKVGLIEVPVARFVDQVADQPTDADLRKLYDQYKNMESSPESETPGFRTPRMVKIDWLLIPENHPFYREQADKLGPVFATLRRFGVVPAIGGHVLPAATLGLDLVLADKLQRYENETPSWRDPGGFGIRSGIHDSTILGAAAGDALTRPTVERNALANNVAALVGGVLGGQATGAPVMSGALTLEGRLVHREVWARTVIGAFTILNANVGPTAPLTIDVATLLLTPRSLTAEQLRPILTERARDELARTLKQADIEAFVAELGKRSAEKDSGNATVYINEFALARQLSRGGMAEPTDVHSLASNPALGDLRAAFDRFAMFMQPAGPDPVGEKFAFYLAFMPEAQRGDKPRTYNPQELFGAKGLYLAWRSVDNESKLQKFDDARPEVVKAWRFAKARELAKKKADELANQAKNADTQKLRDLAASAVGKTLIELPPMARFNRRQSFTAGQTGYQSPEVPRTMVKYPANMANELIELRKKDVGATTVVADQPKATYYAAVMTEKLVPSMGEFRMAYMDSMAPEMSRDVLFDYMRAEKRNQFVVDLLTTLRKEAKLEILKKDDAGESPGAE